MQPGRGESCELTLHALRQQLEPFVDRPLRSALRCVAVDLVLYGAALALTLSARAWWFEGAGGLAMGLVASNLFLIGHDASHGSFTRSAALNRLLARVVFLPCLHPSGPWGYTHNRIHHAYTNLRGKDYVWVPLTKADYDRLGPMARALHRAGRHTAGFGLGYTIEVWMRQLLCPALGDPTWRRPACVLDRLLVAVAIAGLAAAAIAAGGGIWLVVCVVLVPFAVLTWQIGFVVYFNHTHPDIPWFAERREWTHLAAQLDATVDLRFPPLLARFAGNIMHHSAHHVHPGVPLANLGAAQSRLNELLGSRAIVETWSLGWHSYVVRTCKLYDYDARCWTDFAGRSTSQPVSELEQALFDLPHA